MAEVKLSRLERVMRGWVQHYNERKYWKRRAAATDPGSKLPKLLRLYYLFYVKRCDAFNNASTGAHLGYGASFADVPVLPHGLYGIIVSHHASIGRECTIFHQVTIGEARPGAGAPQIGDHVRIGAGAKLLGPIKIGNHVRVGANCVVTQDIPDGASVRAPEGIVRIHIEKAE